MMSKGFYRCLAVDNLKKNKRIYFPYIMTIMASVAMFYIIRSLSINPGFKNMLGDTAMNEILMFACWVARVFIVIFLLYTNSFLIKRRKREFGLYHVLGMEKKHLAVVLFWESVYVLAISLVTGVIAGIVLDKLMFMLLIRVLGFAVPLGFFISPSAILSTLLLFVVVIAVNYIYDLVQIHSASPIELLHGSNVGEKEPKAKWFLAVLGCVCLAGGYYISVTTEDALASIYLFFVAVLLVIAGTYLLFTAGSIAFLKILKNNKKFYYQTRHFASVSGMLYRMKQNAIGLAQICILSTMVLVMVSATSSMMFGMEDINKTRFPRQIMCYSQGSAEQDQQMISQIEKMETETGYTIKNQTYFRGLTMAASQNGDNFFLNADSGLRGDGIVVACMSLKDYNGSLGKTETLDQDQILIHENRKVYGKKEFHILGFDYQVKKEVAEVTQSGMFASYVNDVVYVVLPDDAALEAMEEAHSSYYGGNCEGIRSVYGYDLDANEEAQKAEGERIKSFVTESGLGYEVECRAAEQSVMLSLYGGLFFTGAFLAVLFIMATVLIIYYKQISEGYEDRERFAIMQKVGMTKKEVSASIRSQILMVFFLPLVLAGIHLCFAFPIIYRLLTLMNMLNKNLYLECMGVCFVIFALIYVAIYLGTARTYNRIVQDN